MTVRLRQLYLAPNMGADFPLVTSPTPIPKYSWDCLCCNIGDGQNDSCKQVYSVGMKDPFKKVAKTKKCVLMKIYFPMKLKNKWKDN